MGVTPVQVQVVLGPDGIGFEELTRARCVSPFPKILQICEELTSGELAPTARIFEAVKFGSRFAQTVQFEVRALTHRGASSDCRRCDQRRS